MSAYEVFHHNEHVDGMIDDEGDIYPSGWYWWSCFPGCMPDSDPFGPFNTSGLAEIDARGDEDDGETLCDSLNGAGYLGLSISERESLKRNDYASETNLGE